MFGRVWEALRVRSPSLHRQLSRPLTIPLVIVGMCGLTALWRWLFQTNMNHRRPIEDDQDEQPKKKPATRASITALAMEELSTKKSLRDFGYDFNETGELLNIQTGERFEFKVKEDHKYNQKRYEMIGELVSEHVYQH